ELMQKNQQIKLSTFFGFLFVMISCTTSANDFRFVVSDLEGQVLDYNNGAMETNSTVLSRSLVINVRDGSINLDTGHTTIDEGIVREVSHQRPFLFPAQLASWIVSSYPSLGFALDNVHSAASEYGGGRMLSYSGKCPIIKD